LLHTTNTATTKQTTLNYVTSSGPHRYWVVVAVVLVDVLSLCLFCRCGLRRRRPVFVAVVVVWSLSLCVLLLRVVLMGLVLLWCVLL
jgi:hypothetical protein